MFHKEFYATELGKAFKKFENDLISYWVYDQKEYPNYAKLQKLGEASEESRKTFIALVEKASER